MSPIKTGIRLEVFANTVGSYYKIRSDIHQCPICSVHVAYQTPDTQAEAEHYMKGYNILKADDQVTLNG